jgi:hypothetical protein
MHTNYLRAQTTTNPTPILSRFKGLLKLSSTLFGVVFCLLLASWLFIQDEELSPVITRLQAQNIAKPNAQNAFFTLYGLRSPIIENGKAVDWKRFGFEYALATQQNDRRAVDSMYARQISSSTGLQSAFATISKESNQWCRTNEPNQCTDRALQFAKEVLPLVSPSEPLLVRFKELLALNDFIEIIPASPSIPIVAYTEPINLSLIIEMQIAADMVNEQYRERGFHTLAQLVQFWRKGTIESNTVLNQHVFATQFAKRLRFAFEILEQHPELAAKFPALTQSILKPLNMTDVNFAKLLDGELLFGVGSIAESFKSTQSEDLSESLNQTLSAIFHRLWVRPNSISNAYAKEVDQLKHELTKPSFIQTINGTQSQSTEVRTNYWLPSLYFYNFLGKTTIGSGLTAEHLRNQWSYLLANSFDVVTYSRLIAVAHKIKTKKIANAEVSAYLRTLPEEFNNPYTNAAFDWNRTTKTVYFEPRSSRMKAEFAQFKL